MERQGARASLGTARRALIALALAVLSLGAFLGAASRPGRDAAGVHVRFRQLNWRGADKAVRVPNSRVGFATFSFDRSAAPKLVDRGGFLNLVVQVPGRSGREWVVRNLRLRYKDERFLLGSRPGVQFPLPTPNGQRVAALEYLVTVTPRPLVSAPAGGLSAAAVEAKNYRVGGLNGGGSDVAGLVARVRPFVGHRPVKAGTDVDDDEDFPVLDVGASTRVPAGDLPEIDEDTNGCAPASVARSIQYMMDNQEVFIDYSAQDIYDSLYGNMGTTVQDGTADQDIADGKAQFASDNGLDITTTLTDDGVGSIGDAMDTLNGGGDVELLISWTGGGGHAAMISSIVDNGDGTYTITYVDDPDQGDGVAENEEVTIVVDGDGNILEGGSGHVDGMLIESLHASPPPPPPGGGGGPAPIHTGTDGIGH
jgi:hypothetical protein